MCFNRLCGIGFTCCTLYCVYRFYKRWKEEEQRQAHTQGFSIGEDQLQQDWAAVLALADQKQKSLEQIHVFALAHILRRPIVVYGVKVVKNYRGENLGFVNFEGATFHPSTHCVLFLQGIIIVFISFYGRSIFIFRCVSSTDLGDQLLLQECHCSGLHARPLLCPCQYAHLTDQ